MERKDVFIVVEELFRVLLKNNSLNISEETTETDVEGWNSLFQVALVYELEKRYDIKFKLREIISWETVSDIIDSIEEHLS